MRGIPGGGTQDEGTYPRVTGVQGERYHKWVRDTPRVRGITG